MKLRTQDQSITSRLARGAFAVALAFGATAVPAQGIFRHVDAGGHVSYTDRAEAPITSRELESPAVKAEPVSSIRGRSPTTRSRAKDIDRKEAARRLAQAQRALARGPDMLHGIPPAVEKEPGDRRRARLVALHRGVEAAEARAREVNAPDYSADATPRAAPVRLAQELETRHQQE